MANRFPLIVDSSGVAALKEIPSGDNLDLTGNGIVGAGTVALTNLTVGGAQGSDGQVLTSTGSGIAWEDASGGSSTFGVATMTGDGSDTTLTLTSDPASENNTQVFIDGVYQPKSSYSVSGTTLTFSTAPPNGTSVEAIVGSSSPAGVPSDASVTSAKLSGALTTPSTLTLGGNLDVSGHDIVTVSNAAIELDPNGSGVVTFKGNATRGAGQFKLNCENNSHGITIKGPPHSAAASYTLTLPNTDGNADQVLKTNGSGVLDWVDQSSGGGGGAWTRISTSTISSTTAELEISLSGYTEYVLRFFGVNLGTTARWVNIYMTTSGGNYSESLMYGRWGYASNISSGSGSSSQSASYIHGYAGGMVHSTNGNIFGNLNITNVVGQPALYGLMGTSDEHASNGAGWQTVMARYVSPGSSDTIAKLKFKPDSGFLEAGTYVLYGLSTS